MESPGQAAAVEREETSQPTHGSQENISAVRPKTTKPIPRREKNIPAVRPEATKPEKQTTKPNVEGGWDCMV